MGEPNGEPTSTGIRPRQAMYGHSRGWQMPHRATSSHVQRRYELALQARGHWFDPSCAHPKRAGQTTDLGPIAWIPRSPDPHLTVVMNVDRRQSAAPIGPGMARRKGLKAAALEQIGRASCRERG